MNGLFHLLYAARAGQEAAEANLNAQRGLERAAEAQRDLASLEDRLDRLLLVCTALWELLRDRTELTEEDLLAKVQEVDLRDGQADGKISRTVKKCPACGRTMSLRHRQCLYCGQTDLTSGAFDMAG